MRTEGCDSCLSEVSMEKTVTALLTPSPHQHVLFNKVTDVLCWVASLSPDLATWGRGSRDCRGDRAPRGGATGLLSVCWAWGSTLHLLTNTLPFPQP